MKITYDKDADAIYIKLTNEKFSKTRIVDRNTILNLDENDNVIGIELLFVSKRIPKNLFSNISVENLTT